MIDVVSPSAAQRKKIVLSELQGMVPLLVIGAAVLQNGARLNHENRLAR